MGDILKGSLRQSQDSFVTAEYKSEGKQTDQKKISETFTTFEI